MLLHAVGGAPRSSCLLPAAGGVEATAATAPVLLRSMPPKRSPAPPQPMLLLPTPPQGVAAARGAAVLVGGLAPTTREAMLAAGMMPGGRVGVQAKGWERPSSGADAAWGSGWDRPSWGAEAAVFMRGGGGCRITGCSNAGGAEGAGCMAQKPLLKAGMPVAAGLPRAWWRLKFKPPGCHVKLFELMDCNEAWLLCCCSSCAL
mmetsp:Transcript_8119/g.21653  ORF Transcript_8119/g.21653 Transcript_8119/m.21653 type:complete len:203 (-) Transcript_8119:206-814(-)